MSLILIINGPNLNMLGKRESDIYGTTSIDDVEALCRRRASIHGFKIGFHQSNSEAQIVEWIQGAFEGVAGLIINAAAFTHTSVAILDALKMINCPIIELHISNPHRREAFRHHSYVAQAADGIICGFGINGYALAVDAMADLIKTGQANAL